MIRDRIVLGTKHKQLQEKMLREADLKLDRAVEICKAHEVTKVQLDGIRNDTPIEIHKICEKERKPRDKYKFKNNLEQNNKKNSCSKCGYKHGYGKCPAYDKLCKKCGRKNHFAKLCRNKLTATINKETEEGLGDTERVIWEIKQTGKTTDWYEEIEIVNKGTIKLKIDSGSDANIVNISELENIMGKVILEPSRGCLISYTSHDIPVVGQITLDCILNNKRLSLNFKVVRDGKLQSLLGRDAANKYGLLNPTSRKRTVESICSEDTLNNMQLLLKYKGVFEGMGKMKTKYKIRINKEIIPVAIPARKIPIALQDKVKKEIQRLVQDDILEKVKGFTDWVSPLVLNIKPNNELRICMDPRKLNEAVYREKHWLPTAETLFKDLNKANYFTVLDAKSAFHQVQLDKDSSILCTVATPFGRYRYKRLPYGLCSAPEVFQKMIQDVLEGLDGVVNYIDDILVFGETLEQHNNRLDKALARIEKSGLKLNAPKTQLAEREIRFLGHIISSEGIKADPKKKEAINKMVKPQNKTELQTFLGLTTYLSKYIPDLSAETKELRELLKKRNAWVWEDEGPQQRAFERVKSLVCNIPVLQHFDENKMVKLSVDASSRGLGAVLLQEKGPIAYASAALTSPQTRYSQIEKELLAIVFACEHFDYYVRGRTVEIETDHKPLLGIMGKEIDELTPRLQRMVMRLLRYTVTLKHVPGKYIQAADALSRSIGIETIDTKYINEISVTPNLKVSNSNKMQMLIEATKKDEQLEAVKRMCEEGWPKTKKKAGKITEDYWSVRENLIVQDGLIMKNKQICVPKSLIKEMLSVIHDSHQGVKACKMRAAQSVYWPNINDDIEQFVVTCEICQQYAKANVKEGITPHPVPTLPWDKIAMDFKHYKGVDFLVVIDYFSKFLVVNKVENKTSETIISTMKNIFAIHGLPLEVFTDNGPPFNSGEVAKFLQEYDIKNTFSSPAYPVSNGMIERMNQTFKAMVVKVNLDSGDLMRAVLNYNATPKNNMESPSEVLMGRRIRTLIPMTIRSRTPKYDIEYHRAKLRENNIKMTKMRIPRRLAPLELEQEVWYQVASRQWKPAKIKRQLDNNSFHIITDNGLVLRRNRIQLRPRRVRQEEIVKGDGKTKEAEIDTSEKLRSGRSCISVDSEIEGVNPEDRGGNIDSQIEGVNPEDIGGKLENESEQFGKGCQSLRSGRLIKPPKYLEQYVKI